MVCLSDFHEAEAEHLRMRATLWANCEVRYCYKAH